MNIICKIFGHSVESMGIRLYNIYICHCSRCYRQLAYDEDTKELIQII